MFILDSQGRFQLTGAGAFMDSASCGEITVTFTLDNDITVEKQDSPGYCNGGAPAAWKAYTFLATTYAGTVDLAKCSAYARLWETDLGDGWSAWVEIDYYECAWRVALIIGNYDEDGNPHPGHTTNVAVGWHMYGPEDRTDPAGSYGDATNQGVPCHYNPEAAEDVTGSLS